MKLTPRVMGLLVLGVIATAIGAYMIADRALGPKRSSEESVAAVFEAESPRFVQALQQAFPKDYDALIDRAVDLQSNGAGKIELRGALSSASAEIASRYADVARRAPEPQLKAWLETVAQSIEAVTAAGGPQLCRSFLDQGPEAFADIEQKQDLQERIDARNAALVMALAAARESSEPPAAEPTESDWAAVDAQMRVDGVPSDYADLLIKNDTQNDDYCPALVQLFRNIEDMPGDAGRRIRTEYLANSVS